VDTWRKDNKKLVWTKSFLCRY